MSLFQRIRQAIVVGGMESFGTALGGIAGLLIVNFLPKEQYAAYTFLLACMALMSGIGELGLSHCVLPVVGRRAGEPRWVVGVCHEIFRWRWILLAFGMVIVVPYWLNASVKHGWLSPEYLAASAAAVVVALLTLRASYSYAILMLLRHISALNRASLAMHCSRFALVALVLLAPLNAWASMGLLLATAASQAVDIWLQQRAVKANGIAAWRLDAQERKVVHRETLRIALPLVPSAVFFQIQGVITVLIVSVFGTTDMMAEVGALGRLAMILVVLDRVTNMLLFPAIARSPGGPSFLRKLLLVNAAYLGAMLLIFLSSLALPHYWMLLLGPQYKAQEPHLWMAIGAYVLTSASGFAFRTLAGRGATTRQWITIPLVIAVQVAFVAGVGVGSLPQVLAFNLATSFTHFAFQYGLVLLRIPEWRTAR